MGIARRRNAAQRGGGDFPPRSLDRELVMLATNKFFVTRRRCCRCFSFFSLAAVPQPPLPPTGDDLRCRRLIIDRSALPSTIISTIPQAAPTFEPNFQPSDCIPERKHGGSRP